MDIELKNQSVVEIGKAVGDNVNTMIPQSRALQPQMGGGQVAAIGSAVADVCAGVCARVVIVRVVVGAAVDAVVARVSVVLAFVDAIVFIVVAVAAVVEVVAGLGAAAVVVARARVRLYFLRRAGRGSRLGSLLQRKSGGGRCGGSGFRGRRRFFCLRFCWCLRLCLRFCLGLRLGLRL